VTGPEPLIECEWRGCDCDCEALLHTTTTWNRNPNFTAVASKGYFQLACKLCSFRRLFEAFSQNSRSACSIIIRQELDSVSGNCCGETIRSRPIHHMRACFALHVEASEGFHLNFIAKVGELGCRRPLQFKDNSRSQDNGHDFSRVSKHRKIRGPDSERAASKYKRCTKLSNPMIPIVRAKYARKMRDQALHENIECYTITILSGRPSVSRSRSRPPVHQPLTDPQPQYSLNLNFLPISRLRALTVALSEGFVFPSSRTSPLAFKA
jgi:hypothetical protein